MALSNDKIKRNKHKLDNFNSNKSLKKQTEYVLRNDLIELKNELNNEEVIKINNEISKVKSLLKVKTPLEKLNKTLYIRINKRDDFEEYENSFDIIDDGEDKLLLIRTLFNEYKYEVHENDDDRTKAFLKDYENSLKNVENLAKIGEYQINLDGKDIFVEGGEKTFSKTSQKNLMKIIKIKELEFRLKQITLIIENIENVAKNISHNIKKEQNRLTIEMSLDDLEE